MKRVVKGWGFEKWIVNKPDYCGKLLFFFEGKRCSYHYHKLKDETFYLQSGRMILKTSYDKQLEDAGVRILEAGDRFHIPIGLVHQMTAITECELFEFSTEHFDEDSYRIVKGD